MPLPSPTVTAALLELDSEYNSLRAQIVQLRSQSTCASLLTVASFEELTALYKRRDQLANVLNNLRAYYAAS